MNKIIIKKQSEEIIYESVVRQIVFSINGKSLRVNFTSSTDDEQGNDYEINEDDKAKLTDEEYEVFQDENIWDLSRKLVGKTIEVNGWK